MSTQPTRKERNRTVAKDIETIYKHCLTISTDKDMVHKFIQAYLTAEDDERFHKMILLLHDIKYLRRSFKLFLIRVQRRASKKECREISFSLCAPVQTDYTYEQIADMLIASQRLTNGLLRHNMTVDQKARYREAERKLCDPKILALPVAARARVAIEAIEAHIPCSRVDLCEILKITEATLCQYIKRDYQRGIAKR